MNDTMIASVPAVMTKEKKQPLFGYVSKQSNKSKESEKSRSSYNQDIG